jgi:protein-disulfide isomerase
VSEGGIRMAIGGIAALLGAGGTALALGAGQPVNTTDRAAIESIVREYILTHPEILPEAMQNLQAREAAKIVQDNRAAIETPYKGAWEGAANGDVVLVEFFDYACGYCRAAIGDIKRLIAEDKKLKVVYREMPVLGDASLNAAKISLVAAQQGKYMAYHKAVFAAGRPSPAALENAQNLAGMDKTAVNTVLKSSDIETEISRNLEMQRALSLSGTPSWVVGDKVLVGAVGYDALKKAIAEARARKN